MLPRYLKQLLAVALLLIGIIAVQQSLYAQCVPPPSGMVAWWPLDETAGTTANDIAGSVNNTGTWMNGPAPVAGKVAGALSFSGSNSVDVPDQAELNFGTGDFSIDLWIRTTNASGTSTFLDKRVLSGSYKGYVLFLLNGCLSSEIGDGAGYNNWVTTGFVADGNWHHIAVTVDRDNPSGWLHYVDGVAVGPIANPTNYQGSLTNTAPFVMGRNLITPSHTFAGTLDEVELFDRVLSPSEVYSIWNAGDFGKCRDTCDATGDANHDGISPTFADLVYLQAFINGSGPAPVPLYSCDLNSDCVVDAIDVQVYLNYFTQGIGAFDPYGGYPVQTCCDPTAGSIILGACCLPDGSCVPNLTEGVCDEMSGGPDNWHPNVSCTPNPCDTCIAVPADLVAWYPFDETGPSTSHDIAGLYNATHLNYPGFAPGKVNGAFRTNWNPNPVNRGTARTVSDPFETVQSGDFTIDAWVYPEDLLLGGAWAPELDRIIMSNRDSNNGLMFFVRTDPVTKLGSICLLMYGDANNSTLYLTSTTPVAPNEWNHVAVTVSRSVGGGKFYHNGVSVGPTFTPRLEDMQCGPLQIGHCDPQCGLHVPGGCGWTNRYFSGLIDELQIFKRALEPDEIAEIFNADERGKCRDHCSLPYVVRMDNNQLTATAALTIYNGSGESHDYTCSAEGLPPDPPTLNTSGIPMTFTYSPSQTVTIPALGHEVIYVTMTRPFPYPTFGLGDFAGFKVLSSRTDPGSPTFTCQSSVYGTGQWTPWIVDHIGEAYMSPLVMYPGDGDSIDFRVVNEADSSGGLFKYEIRVIPGCLCDNSDDEIVVGLNSLPVGTNIIDSVTVPLGDSAVITVNVELLKYKPFNFQNVVLLADWDKDGELEPAAAATIHPMTFQDCNSNGQSDSLDIALGTSIDANGNGFPDECETGTQGCPYCYTALGEASVTCNPVANTLTVTDIGSSGNSGVALDCAGAPSIHPAWQSFDPEGTLPAGASITVTAIGEVDSISNRIISIGRAEKLPTGSWLISADQSSIGATSRTIKVYRNHSLVATVTGYAGLAVAVSWLDPEDWETNKAGESVPTWNQPTGITLLGARDADSITVVGDKLRIIPENATAHIQGLSQMNLTAANIDSITITNIAFGVPLPGDANGNGIVNISDAVYLINFIFSGGQAPNPLLAGDANCDGRINISDVVYLINYIFAGGPAPC